ncbi:restriction endonuclease subunit S [Bacteroides fragilis]|uniref:restriction endonuclease subunit S n=4 Tax=Bacteroides TaxID=816 RepID=UPI0039B65FB1
MADNKNNNERNVPPLRFPEFCGEWECTSIGNIGEIKNGPFGSVLHAEDYVEEGIPIVTTEHFKTGLMPSDKFGIPQVSNEDYIRLKGYRLETNDIVFSRVGSVDINAHVGIEQNGWLFSGRVLRVRPKHDVDSLFLHYALSTEAVKRDIRNRAVGQTMPSINTPILSSTTIRLPKELSEQKKVAHFLRLLDERIATQNKIIEDLKKLKSAITNLLFHSIIEVNTVRLGDIAHITNGVGDVQDANTEYRKDWYPFFDRSEELKWFPTYSFDKEAIIYAGEGQSFYPRYYKGKFALHQRCYAITDFTSCILPRYCYHFMTTLNSYFIRNSVGSTVPSLRMDIFQKAEIKLPPISKQQHICKIIDALYAKLEVEHNTLNSLQLQKQHMLRQMFI